MTERDRLLEALRVARDRAMRPTAGAVEIQALDLALSRWRAYVTRLALRTTEARIA